MPVPVDMSRPRLNVEFIGLYTGQKETKLIATIGIRPTVEYVHVERAGNK